jgi:hypothetical protein
MESVGIRGGEDDIRDHDYRQKDRSVHIYHFLSPVRKRVLPGEAAIFSFVLRV